MTAEPDEDPNSRRSPFRDEVWGDEPQEVDADKLAEELATTQPELARRWHDHPTFVPIKILTRFIGRNGKRVAVTIAGCEAVAGKGSTAGFTGTDDARSGFYPVIPTTEVVREGRGGRGLAVLIGLARHPSLLLS